MVQTWPLLIQLTSKLHARMLNTTYSFDGSGFYVNVSTALLCPCLVNPNNIYNFYKFSNSYGINNVWWGLKLHKHAQSCPLLCILYFLVSITGRIQYMSRHMSRQSISCWEYSVSFLFILFWVLLYPDTMYIVFCFLLLIFTEIHFI